jgi:hypothetical protein
VGSGAYTPSTPKFGLAVLVAAQKLGFKATLEVGSLGPYHSLLFRNLVFPKYVKIHANIGFRFNL